MYTHIGQLDSEQQRAWREYWFVNRAECLHHCLFGSLVQVLEFDNPLDIGGWSDHGTRTWDCVKLQCSDRSSTFQGATVQGSPFEDVLEQWEFEYPGLRVAYEGRGGNGYFCHTLPVEISALVRARVWTSYSAGGGSRKYIRGLLATHLAGKQLLFCKFYATS